MKISYDFQNYPLIKVFNNGKGRIIYDAKSDFAFFVSEKEFGFLKIILENDTVPEVFESNQDFLKFQKAIERIKSCGVFVRGPAKNIGPRDLEEIKKLVEYYKENIVIRKFNIEVTEDCTFRCKYCPNTLAETGRTHTKKYISEETANKAIDFYFDTYAKQLRKLSKEKQKELLTLNAPGIGWYGGEPLLNFDVIKKSHKYFLRKNWDEFDADRSTFVFGLTTNLGYISLEMIDYFVENNVMLYVSIDGPEEEHNKNRVYKDGKGTFNSVYKNILKIKSLHPEYYGSKVFIISVNTKNLDNLKCEEFFSKSNQSANEIAGYKSRIVSDYSERGKIIPDAKEKIINLNEVKEESLRYFNEKLESLSDKDFEALEKDDFLPEFFQGLNSFLKIKYDKPYGCNNIHSIGTCPMGFDNLMVGADGNFHMCHKTDGSLPIGNTDTGLDYEKIAVSYFKFNETLSNDNCKNCWAVRLCKACAAVKLNDGNFINASKDECNFIRKSSEYLFNKFIMLQNYENLMKFFEEKEKFNTDIGVIDINNFINKE